MKPGDRIVIAEPEEVGKALTFAGALYTEQVPGSMRAAEVLKEKHGVMVRAECGSGKTVVGTYLMSGVKGERTVVLVDQTAIAEQWTKEIRTHLPEATISYIMPLDDQKSICKKYGMSAEGRTHDDLKGRIVIAMAQSVMRKKWDPPIPAIMLVVDEAHKFSAPRFAEAIFSFAFRYSVSLTATDKRADGLEWIFKMALGPRTVNLVGRRMQATVLQMLASTSNRIDDEDHVMLWCAKPSQEKPGGHATSHARCRTECGNVKMCNWRKSCSTRKILYGDIWQALAGDVLYNAWLARAAVELYETGRQVIIYSKFKEHLTRLRKWVVKLGVPEADTSLYFGGMDKDTCMKPPLTFATYGVGEHALDVPHKDSTILAIPISRLQQTSGRIERVAEGKRTPIIVEPYILGTKFYQILTENHQKFFRSKNYVVLRDPSPEVARALLDPSGKACHRKRA